MLAGAADAQVTSFHMQDSGWYHGPLSRTEAEARLKQPEALPGDYLVRESGGLDGFLALTVKLDPGLIHYLINIHRDLFYVGTLRATPSDRDELFPSIEVRVRVCGVCLCACVLVFLW